MTEVGRAGVTDVGRGCDGVRCAGVTEVRRVGVMER